MSKVIFSFFLFSFVLFSCSSEQQSQDKKEKKEFESTFGEVVYYLNAELEKITPKYLPHNPDIAIEQYYLTDVSTSSEPCRLELKIISSNEKDVDPWVEERTYQFWTGYLDSVSYDDYAITLYYNGNSALGFANVDYRDRESSTRDVRLFYREDIGYYFLIYPESRDQAAMIKGYFDQLKTSCGQ